MKHSDFHSSNVGAPFVSPLGKFVMRIAALMLPLNLVTSINFLVQPRRLDACGWTIILFIQTHMSVDSWAQTLWNTFDACLQIGLFGLILWSLIFYCKSLIIFVNKEIRQSLENPPIKPLFSLLLMQTEFVSHRNWLRNGGCCFSIISVFSNKMLA